MQKYDIFGAIETWGDDLNEFDSFLSSHKHFGYVRNRAQNSFRNSGGVSAFVKYEHIESGFIKRICHDFLDCIVLFLKTSLYGLPNDIILYIAYVSPEGSSIYRDENNGILLLENNLSLIKNKYNECSLYLAGDFNARTSDLLDYIPDDNLRYVYNMDVDYNSDMFDLHRNNTDCERYNLFGKSLIELCCSFDVHIINGRVHNDIQGNITCCANGGRSVVDYHIISSQLFPYISFFNVEELDCSDHFPLLARISIPMYMNPREENLPSKVLSYDSFIWQDRFAGDFMHEFATLIQMQGQSILDSVHEDINKAIRMLLSVYKKAASQMQRTRSPIKPKKPKWWDRLCSQLKRNKTVLLRYFRKTNNEYDFVMYKDARCHFKNVCHQKQVNYQTSKRNELLLSSNNPKLFWSTLKRETNKTESFCSVKPNDWATYFQSLLFKDNQASITGLANPTEAPDDVLVDGILNMPISNEEIEKSIDKLKLGKAHGVDGIGAEFYKNTKTLVVPLLNEIFNKILLSGVFPDSWCTSIITPIYKSGGKNDPANYRGIALIDIMYKIFSGIITDRLIRWSDYCNVIDESQAGFRAGYSVVDNMFTLQCVIQKYLSKPRGRFYVLYVDFQKAFDSLVHHKLFTILKNKGLKGKLVNVIISMYSKLKAHVKVHGTDYLTSDVSENSDVRKSFSLMTEAFDCNIGTRQGDLYSPILFILFINDLCQYLKDNCNQGIYINEHFPDLYCLMYADDVANCADTAINLQRQLNAISTFCHDYGMHINLKKTEIIVFRNGGPLRHYEKWSLNGQRVNTTSMYKYMGLLFTPKLSWSAAKAKLAAQARKAVFSIKNYQRSFGTFNHNEIFKLFDAMIVPILTFGAEVWGFSESKEIEKVQLEFCKYFLGVKSSVNNCVVLGECGRLTLYTVYVSKCIKYWCKLLQMPNDRLPRNSYDMIKNLDNIGRRTWATYVKEILFRYGFGYVWISQDVGDVDLFMHAFKTRISDCCKQNWHDDVNTSSRCDTYKCFKSLLNVEKYLNVGLSFPLRKSLARFRTSSHKLHIEVGRYYSIERHDRICIYCLLNDDILVVEDEYHVFFICPRFAEIRQSHLLNWFSGNRDLYNFNNIMTTDNVKHIRCLAVYVHKLMNAIDFS